MSASYDCCVLSRRGLCNVLITRPEESYQVWCVWVWFRNLNLTVEPPVGGEKDTILAMTLKSWSWSCLHGFPTNGQLSSSSSFLLILLLLLLPLALQPAVGFGLSSNVLPFFPICHWLSPFSTPSTWRSLSASSFHLFRGFPLLLDASSSWVKIFLGILSYSIVSRWPNHLILCHFIHFTTFSPLLISSKWRRTLCLNLKL